VRKSGTFIKASTTESLAAYKAFEDVVAGDVGDIADQQLAQNFEAMLFAACSCVTQHAIGLDDFLKGHEIRVLPEIAGAIR